MPPIRDRFPELELLLVEEKTDDVIERLRDGRLDAGILASPISSDTLRVEVLFVEHFVLAVPRGHPLAGETGPIPVSSIAREPILLLEEGHCLRDQALSVCRMIGAAERPGFRATSLETLRQMVAAGVGVTLLPELAVQPPVAASSQMSLIRLSEPVPHREIVLCWRPTSVFRELLPEMADLIRATIGPLVEGGAVVPLTT